ncbi:MAG: serine/threonine-protein kinase [Rivularia sp. (in: cyanobacteria)]
MICCLNPICYNPPCTEETNVCPNCQTPLVILRNRYQPIQPLGGGGFGKTYIAEDIDKLNEYCVIKQFAPQVQGTAGFESAKKLFEAEARRLQQLGENPRIPSLLAYFEENSRLYLLQQFIDGQNLLQELEQQGIFNEQKILQLLFDVLPIFQVVHQQKVIHRDIKPENIIRRLIDDKLVLIDFGASKQWSQTIMSVEGTMIGSFGYVPIEQIEDGKAYPSSDLYSLGATCFHLLSGIRPWKLWYKKGYGWVNDWRSHLNQPVSQELGEILDRLLQEDYKKRYQSVAQVLQDLNSLPIASVAWQQNSVIFQKSSSSPQVPETIVNPSKASRKISRRLFPFLSRKKIKFKQLLLVIGGVLLAGLGGYGLRYIMISNSPQVKNIDYKQLTFVKTIQGGKGKNCYVYTVALSPNGKTLVNGSDDKSIRFWDFQTQELLYTIKDENPIRSIAISSDGQTFVSGSKDGIIKIWDFKTKKLKKTFQGHKNTIRSIIISRDGETLITGSRDRTIKIWNLQTGELKKEFRNYTSSVLSLALSPDGKTLISGSFNGIINVYNLETGKLENQFPKQNKLISSLVITKDGKRLIGGSGDGSIKIWNLQTGELKKELIKYKTPINSLVISPDGKFLVSGDGYCKVNIWQI